MIATIQRTTLAIPVEWEKLNSDIYASVCQETLSKLLLPAFAEQFGDMNVDEIDGMMKSFAFENCLPREDIVDLLRTAWSRA